MATILKIFRIYYGIAKNPLPFGMILRINDGWRRKPRGHADEFETQWNTTWFSNEISNTCGLKSIIFKTNIVDKSNLILSYKFLFINKVNNINCIF